MARVTSDTQRTRAASFRDSRRAKGERSVRLAALVACWLLLIGAHPVVAASGNLVRFRNVDPAVVARVLALDPRHISAQDVRDTLSLVPAPRIYLIEGSVTFVSMKRFGEFLVAMGYPDERLRDPRDGAYGYSSYNDSADLAGELAWYYERDGMMPMMIGHSQGGMLAIRTLYELAGEFHADIRVRDPVAGAELDRTTIRDPLSGGERPVVGLRAGYAAALATGKLMRVLLGQWSMLSRLRRIPDSVEDFTGFSIPGDPIAGTLFGDEPYRAIGTANVRNVTLPASYSHIGLPDARRLADNAVTRRWIERYVPDEEPAEDPVPGDVDTTNLLHAADIWHSVKKHWCLEAQRVLRARRVDS